MGQGFGRDCSRGGGGVLRKRKISQGLVRPHPRADRENALGGEGKRKLQKRRGGAQAGRRENMMGGRNRVPNGPLGEREGVCDGSITLS